MKEWHRGKYYISDEFEVIQYKGSSNDNDSLLAKGESLEDALDKMYSINNNLGLSFLQIKNIDNIVYYHFI